MIEGMDNRLAGEIKELDIRITGEIASLRNDLQYALKVVVLEAEVLNLRRKWLLTELIRWLLVLEAVRLM